MKSMKIIATTLCATLLLLIGVNMAAALILDVRSLFKSSSRPAEQVSQDIDRKYELAPYKDKKLGYQILSENLNAGFDYKSFIGWSRKPYRGETTTVNKAGDRQHQWSNRNPSGTIRLFGGSTMWGTGAADQGTIPALLNQAMPTYRVFNHGEAGFTSRQSLARLINIANQAEELGIVVFYDGVNDVHVQCLKDGGINTHGNQQSIQGLLEGNSQNASLLNKLENTSLGPIFLTETYKLLLSAKEYFFPNNDGMQQTEKFLSRCQSDPSYARQVATTLINDWKLARSIVESRGGRFIAVLQPVSYVGHPKSEHINKSKRQPRLEGDYKSVYSILRSELRKEPTTWVADFTDVFDVDEPVYIDFCHVTENGNKLVAKRLAALIRGSVDISLNAVPAGEQVQN